MPVIDHERRLVGYVSRKALEEAAMSGQQGSVFIDSLIELVKRYWEFMAYTITFILGRGAKS